MHSAIQLVLLVICIWMVLSWFQRLLGFWGLLLLVHFAFLAGATAFSLRFRRQMLLKIYHYPGARQWIDLIARITALQVPTGESRHAEPSLEIQIRTEEDFQWLRDKLEQRVFGQSQAISATVEQLRQAMALRSRLQSSAPCGPLAVLMWIGPPGIGKRTLAAEIAQRFYRTPLFSEWNLAQASPGQSEKWLLGDSQTEGQLVQSVRLKPHQVLYVDQIQLASPSLRNGLRQIIESGRWFDAKHRGEVGFHQTILILALSDPRFAKDALGMELTNPSGFLCDEFGLEPGFVTAFPAPILFSPLEDLHKGNVIARMMQRECEYYGLRLDYVDAELIAGEILALTAEHGFELTQARIRRALKSPIQKACEAQMDRLSITVDDVQHAMTGIDQ